MGSSQRLRAGARLRLDERGTASLEAAMILPFMALCWLGLFYRLGTLDATLEAGVEARRAAWVTSNNACRGDDTNYECAGSASDDIDTGSFLDGLSDIPIVGFLFGSLLGSSTTAHASREVNRPAAFGGGVFEASYSYYIMCNEEPMTVEDLLRSTICEQLGDALDFAMDCPDPRHEDVPQDCSL